MNSSSTCRWASTAAGGGRGGGGGRTGRGGGSGLSVISAGSRGGGHGEDPLESPGVACGEGSGDAEPVVDLTSSVASVARGSNDRQRHASRVGGMRMREKGVAPDAR